MPPSTVFWFVVPPLALIVLTIAFVVGSRGRGGR
jgi:hypothetical protein